MIYNQIKNPIKNDWFSETNLNLQELGLSHYSIEDIKNFKKEKFKNIVKDACKDAAFKDLTKEIETRNLTKIKNIKYEELKMQTYLKCKELTIKQKKVIFKARTGMLPVGFNFGGKNLCSLCELSDDTEKHLLDCVVIKMNCPDLMENIDTVYNDVYSSSIDKVSKIAKLLSSALRAREILKNNMNT